MQQLSPYHSSNFSFAVSLVSFLLRNMVLRELTRLYASSSFGYSSKRIFARFSCVALHFSRLMANCLRHRVNASTSVSPFLSLGGSKRVFSLFGFLPRLLFFQFFPCLFFLLFYLGKFFLGVGNIDLSDIIEINVNLLRL